MTFHAGKRPIASSRGVDKFCTAAQFWWHLSKVCSSAAFIQIIYFPQQSCVWITMHQLQAWHARFILHWR